MPQVMPGLGWEEVWEGGKKEGRFYCLFVCLTMLHFQNTLGGVRCSVDITEACK